MPAARSSVLFERESSTDLHARAWYASTRQSSADAAWLVEARVTLRLGCRRQPRRIDMWVSMDDGKQYWLTIDEEHMGPFTSAQVQALVSAGHAARETACSTDNVTWQTVGHLFDVDSPAVAAPRKSKRAIRTARERAYAPRGHPAVPSSIWTASIALTLAIVLLVTIAIEIVTISLRSSSPDGGVVPADGSRGIAMPTLLIIVLGFTTWGIMAGYEAARQVALVVLLLHLGFLVYVYEELLMYASDVNTLRPKVVFAALASLLAITALLQRSARMYTAEASTRRRLKHPSRRR